MKSPNYKKIYTDLLNKKFPEKISECTNILSKKELNFIDIIKLNNKIFSDSPYHSPINQKLRSYDKKTIITILAYQKNKKLNNSQLANHFGLSRNTVTKWKKIFDINIH
ncbi:MAG: helix-turn-helix domain-containing protein [Bacilli bacterium]